MEAVRWKCCSRETRGLENLIEVVRRASLVIVWIGGLGLTLVLVITGFNAKGPDGPMIYGAAAVIAFLTWIAAKLVNRVLLK